MSCRTILGIVLMALSVGGCDMPWTTDTGQRIRRECESIVRAAVEVAPDRMSENAQTRAVFACLVESATKGRS